MTSSPKNQARFAVLLGFALVVISSVITYVQGVTSFGYSFASFRGFFAPVTDLLIPVAALAAWWWLSQLRALDTRQLSLLQKGFYALAFQQLLNFFLFLFIVTPFRSFGGFWIEAALWLQGVGGAVTAFGFFLLSRTLSVTTDVNESYVAPA